MSCALCAAGMAVVALTGCEKKAEPPKAVDPSSPVSYMNDPAFRKAVADKRQAMMAIVAERKPLADRMEALVKAYRKDLAALQKLDEWQDLYKKVTALNAKYEAVRQEQLKIVRNRLTPEQAKTLSKSGEVK